MSDAQRPSRLAVLMFTDIVASTQLKSKLGNAAYVRLLTRHDELFRQFCQAASGQILQDTGDGYFAAFQTVSDAVRCALQFQYALSREPWEAEPIRVRLGVHVGEFALVAQEGTAGKVVGMSADVTSRLAGLAQGQQILLSRAVFDEARQFIDMHPPLNGHAIETPIRWIAHGDYLFKGSDEPMEVFEVGAEGIAPLSPPPDSEKARRSVSAEQEETLGWRPAAGLQVPQRPAWKLEKKLGEGTFGEVWLAKHEQLKQHRVFKFCFDAERLRSFKRELTLFRLMRDALGDRKDIARLYDVRLDRPPFFLESEFAPGGNLADWAASQGGINKIALERRLEIVADVADAVAAAHSVGVLHKDIKPSNILVQVDSDGKAQPRLSDFGIGAVMDPSQLARRNITVAGFTGLTINDASRTGTRLYMPPESLAGKAFTTQGDIYALGVFLYQMVVGDLERPIAEGWEREVKDELLREDISRCIEGDPQHRLSSASELAQRIRDLPRRRERRQFERRRRQVGRFLAATFAILILLCSAGVIGYFRERSLRQRAVDAEHLANEQRARADQERRRAEVLLADSFIDHGRQLAVVGNVSAARENLERAREEYSRLGLSTLPADLALLETYALSPPPLLAIEGHTDSVFAVCATADQRLISGGGDGVRIWDILTGRELRRLDAGGRVMSLGLSPDGKTLMSAGTALKLWDLQTFKEICTLPPAGLRAAVMLPDGKRILVARENDRVIQLWNAESRHKELELPPQTTAIRALAVSSDGKQAFVGLDVRSSAGLVVYDLVDGKHVYGFNTPVTDGGIRAISPFADGKRLLIGGYAGQAEICDLAGKTTQRIGPGGAAIVALVMARDGESFLMGREDGSVTIADAHSGEITRRLVGASAGIRALEYAQSGRIVVAAGLDKNLRTWDLASTEHRVATHRSSRHPGTVFALGTRLSVALAWDDPVSVIWDTATGKQVAAVAHDDPMLQRLGYPSLDYDLRWVSDGLEAVDPSGKSKWRIKLDLKDISSLIHDFPEDQLVLLQHRDSSLSVMRFDGTCVGRVPAHGGYANAAHLEAATKHIVTFGAENTLRVWDVPSGKLLQSFAVATGAQPNSWRLMGDWLVTMDAAGAIHAYEVSSGVQRSTMIGHIGGVRHVGINPKTRLVVSGGEDNTVRLWDLSSGRQLFRFGPSAQPLVDLEPGFDDPQDELLIVTERAAGVRELNWWNLNRAADFRAHQERLAKALASLSKNPPDPQALLVFGNWYAFRGMDLWAIELLERARGSGAADVSALTMARCYWKLGRTSEAAREFRVAMQRSEAPQEYLQLCLTAVENPPSSLAQGKVGGSPAAATGPSYRLRLSFSRQPPQTASTAPASRTRVVASQPSDDLDARNIQAWRLRRDGKLEEAVAMRAAVVAEAARMMPADHPRLIKYRLGYGELLHLLNQNEKAEEQYLAVERAIAGQPDTSPQKVDLNQHMARLYLEWKKPEQAKTYEAKLAATRATTSP